MAEELNDERLSELLVTLQDADVPLVGALLDEPPETRDDGELVVDALYAPMLALDDCFRQLPDAGVDIEGVLQDTTSASGGRRKSSGVLRLKRQSNPNKARDARGVEIVLLRGKVSEMEKELETLRAHKSAERQGNHPDATLIDSERSTEHYEADLSRQRLTNAWKELCLRQIHRRMKAERENSRLKRALEGQLKASITIQRLLDRPAGANPDELPKKRSRVASIPPTDPDADRVVFTHLLSEADTLLHEIDLVLEENGIFQSDTRFCGAKMRERSGGLFLDVFATSILPFDVNRTANAVWKHYTSTQKHFGSVYEKTTQQPNDDTIIENFAMGVPSSSIQADFRMRQVFKRWVTAERVVIVWTTDGEPIEYMNKMTNFGFHERGYIVCRPPVANQVESTTVLQICHRISPYELMELQLTSTPSASATGSTNAPAKTINRLRKADVDAIAQFTLSSIDLELKANQEHIENLLLDDTRSGLRTPIP